MTTSNISRFGLLGLGVALVAFLLPTAPAAANPPSGDVSPGQVLPFTAGGGDLSVLFDNRTNCGATPVVYRLVVTAPSQDVSPNPQDNDPDGSFSFSLTVSPDVGFIFPVDVAISGTCGALSAYSAAGRLGLYRIVAGSTPPPAGSVPPEGEKVIGDILGLASDFDRDLDRLHKVKHNDPSRKLNRRVDAAVSDGKEAKQLKADYRQLGLPRQGDVLVPCPVSRLQKRDCTGEVSEKLEDLWGFVKALGDLANYPEYRLKRTNEWYTTSEGKEVLDRLTQLNSFGGNPQHYSQLSRDDKDKIASQAQVYSGALDEALKRARKAGKAGSQLTY